MTVPTILHSANERARLMRRDTAEILTRIFFIERSLIISQAGWLTRAPRIEDKAVLGRILWEDSLAADDMRERIFELRYPRRDVNPDLHRTAVGLYDAARSAPGIEAFVGGLAKVLKPALLEAYRSFNQLSDRLSDGPSALILRHAMNDLEAQIGDLEQMLDQMLVANPAALAATEAWIRSLSAERQRLGGQLLDMTTDPLASPIQLPGSVVFSLPARPARDERFQVQRFYWPHIVDPAYPPDEGIRLQIRSAIGHLNEAWAAEAAAVTLYSFADDLEWEFVRDVARWTYDESRHCLMGFHRLLDWGYQPEELPMGDYIYTTAIQHGPLVMLAMLHHFEARYIHRGHERIETFAAYDDALSRHDYEFDWADETFHAEFGRRWLETLLKRDDAPAHDVEAIREQCNAFLEATTASATAAEKQRITALAGQIIAKAEARVR